MKHVQRRLCGFTLIELLVVVAIIAVLISILLPALGEARKQAKGLLCGTQLRAQGQAAVLYAQANKDWIVRGLSPGIGGLEKMIYAISVLPGLAYDGPTLNLWNGGEHRELLKILPKIPQFQCPTHPVPNQPLDYVASAFPIPYTRQNQDRDERGGPPGDEFRGEPAGFIDYHGMTPLSKIDRYGPARLIYVTEAHKSLPVDDVRFHHTFLANQLPFGSRPRMANDRRHPGGLNNLFFDGHVQMLSLQNMDAGWPANRYLRLRWFSVKPLAE